MLAWVKKVLTPPVKRESPFDIFNGVIHSPFFIFIRCARTYSDNKLLRMLGLKGYTPEEFRSLGQTIVLITEDENWVHIADDWSYTLYYMSKLRDAIDRIAEKHEVYTCSVGDTDSSYDFTYHCDGKLVRKYVVEDPHYRGGEVKEDFGIPIPGEAKAMQLECEWTRVMTIAASLGIDLWHQRDRVRIYAAPSANRFFIER